MYIWTCSFFIRTEYIPPSHHFTTPGRFVGWTPKPFNRALFVSPNPLLEIHDQEKALLDGLRMAFCCGPLLILLIPRHVYTLYIHIIFVRWRRHKCYAGDLFTITGVAFWSFKIWRATVWTNIPMMKNDMSLSVRCKNRIHKCIANRPHIEHLG